MRMPTTVFAGFLFILLSFTSFAAAAPSGELLQQEDNTPIVAVSPVERFQRAELAALALEENWDNFGDVSFWVRGCMVEALINYIAAARDVGQTPNPTIVRKVEAQLDKWNSIKSKLNKDNEDFDDRLWWAMVFVRYYEVIKKDRDLLDNKAAFIFKKLVVDKKAYDDAFGGGVWWQYRVVFKPRQKTAVTNSLFLMVASRLALHYRALGDISQYEYFLEWADKEANWLRNKAPYDIWGRSVGPVGDALVHLQGHSDEGPEVVDIWTYNQGLYTIAMTDYAELIEKSWPLQLAVDHWNGYYNIIWPDGVLRELNNREEPWEWPRNDLMVFKGLAIRHWMYAHDRIKGFSPLMAARIRNVVRNSAESAWTNANDGGKYRFLWENSQLFKYNKWNAETQSSAVDLLSAAVIESTK